MGRMVKRTTVQVGNTVLTEGLGFAISGYLLSDDIEDKELAQLWQEAKNSMHLVQVYLEKKLGEKFFDFTK